MLLLCCNSCALSSQKTFLAYSNPNHNLGRFKHPKRFSSCKFTCVVKVGVDDIAEIVHNKVLIAAGVSAAIGQLSKPFTASLLYGKQFDLMATIQAGGFPSTHSSSVVAAATCLALERGFSDSIFGLTVVYAGLVMYDAQGVRREVGIHARTLNRISKETSEEDNSDALKESIGHTEVEVVAGALLGFFVSLALYAII